MRLVHRFQEERHGRQSAKLQSKNQIKSSSAEHGFGLKFDLQKAGQWSAPLSTTNADVLVAPKNMSGTPSDSCTKGMRQASVESASRTRPEIQVF